MKPLDNKITSSIVSKHLKKKTKAALNRTSCTSENESVLFLKQKNVLRIILRSILRGVINIF